MNQQIEPTGRTDKRNRLPEEQRLVCNWMDDLHLLDRPYILVVKYDGKNYRIYKTEQVEFVRT